jgi:sarcosine oxidase
VNGDEAEHWKSALEKANAPYRWAKAAPASSVSAPGPFLIDPSAAVIDATRVASLLVEATRQSLSAVRVASIDIVPQGAALIGEEGLLGHFDAVAICAGAGTSALASSVGLSIPSDVTHHVRFTFATKQPTPTLCLIEGSGDWRTGFSSYQHPASPTRWAVGMGVPTELCDFRRDVADFVDQVREITTAYAKQIVGSLITSEIVETIYCTTPVGLDDGFRFTRSGSVLAIYGHNLFKFAPLLGGQMADAVMQGETPKSVGL